MSVVFNPGDKVRLTRGEEVLLGEIYKLGPEETRIITGPKLATVRQWESEGWTVSVVPSTPTPTLLPKGWYLSPYQEIWWLQDNGFCTQPNAVGRMHQSEMRDIAKFTRIDTRESWRASWANEIADWIERKSGIRQLLGEEIRREFGGTVVDE